MLIRCVECGQNISDTAPTCPHCGFSRVNKQNVAHVQTTWGNQFFDPAENARGCLRVIFLGLVGVGVVFALLCFLSYH